MKLPESVLVKKQVKTYEKIFKENNINHRIVCKVRYDLDDKIYRLERNISDHDSRIRKLEMKVR